MKKLTYLLSFAFLILSCSSDNNVIGNDSNEGSFSNNDNNLSDKLFVRKIIETYPNGEQYDINFAYNGNKLVEMSSSADKNSFKYDENGLLTNIRQLTYNSTGNKILNTSFIYNANNELVSYMNQFENSLLVERYDVEFNEIGYLVADHFTGTTSEQTSLEETFIFPYENGNRLKDNFASYSYDNSNGLFKNIHAIDVLKTLQIMAVGETDLITGNNNPTNITEQDEMGNITVYDYEYTYNFYNYPLEAVVMEDGIVKSTIEYYYYNN